jgi:hypothetical protein
MSEIQVRRQEIQRPSSQPTPPQPAFPGEVSGARTRFQQLVEVVRHCGLSVRKGTVKHRFHVGAVGAAVLVVAALSSPSAMASSLSALRGAKPATRTAAAAAWVPHTVVLSVRPVNASHRLAAGYHVQHVFSGTCAPGSDVATAATGQVRPVPGCTLVDFGDPDQALGTSAAASTARACF